MMGRVVAALLPTTNFRPIKLVLSAIPGYLVIPCDSTATTFPSNHYYDYAKICKVSFFDKKKTGLIEAKTIFTEASCTILYNNNVLHQSALHKLGNSSLLDPFGETKSFFVKKRRMFTRRLGDFTNFGEVMQTHTKNTCSRAKVAFRPSKGRTYSQKKIHTKEQSQECVFW